MEQVKQLSLVNLLRRAIPPMRVARVEIVDSAHLLIAWFDCEGDRHSSNLREAVDWYGWLPVIDVRPYHDGLEIVLEDRDM